MTLYYYLSEHIDYIFFFSGISFMMLSAVCFLLNNDGTHNIPWLWLGLFGIVYGTNEILSLIALAVGDSTFLSAIRLIILTISFLFLLKFGIKKIKIRRGNEIGKLIIPVLIVLALIGIKWGMTGLNVTVSYLLGFPAAFITAVNFFLLAKEYDQLSSYWLRITSVSFAIYSIITGFITPAANFWPASVINQDSFFTFFKFPVHFIRGLCAITATTSIAFWNSMTCEKCSSDPFLREIKIKYVIRTTTAIILTMLMGWVLTEYLEDYGKSVFSNTFLSRAITASSAIDNANLLKLDASYHDLGKKGYYEIRNQLITMRKLNKDCRFIYLVGTRDNRVFFYANSEPANSPDYLPPGSYFEEATKEFIKGIKGQNPFIEGPSRDRRGYWISALAPVKDPVTKKVIAFLGMNIDGSGWKHQIHLYRLGAIMVTFMVCVFIFFFFIIWKRNREATLEITRLQVATVKEEDEKKLKNITANLGEGLFVLDTQGNLSFINPEAEKLLGWNVSEVMNNKVHDFILVKNSDGTEEYANIEYILNSLGHGEIYRCENDYFVRDNNVAFPVSYVATPLLENGQVVGVVIAFQDISMRKRTEEKIRYLAYYDTLTGLPNRVLFEDRLKRALGRAYSHGHKVAVIFLDLDRFKTVNDTLGHSVGDQLLQMVTSRIQGCVRERDCVARFGGDEFTILLSKVDELKEVAAVAQRIVRSLKRPLILADREFYITPSMGISIYPNDGTDAVTLLKNADAAMYLAKEQGRNGFRMYAEAMNKRTMEHLEITHDMRRALKRQEFVVYYQPKTEVLTRKIVGIEALVRWKHPEKGLLLPNEFIPLAEETGFIIPLGEWVLRQACEQNKSWHDSGYDFLRVSVNISARQLQQPEFVETVAIILKETKLQPGFLELEITENVAIQDDYIQSVVKNLKNLGVHISVDDFGTGYSFLSYLRKRPPIDSLKIDRSFIDDISEAEDTATALVDSIIVLAKNLDLRVVAEGVTTEEQVRFLIKRNCDEMQGFLFSPAVPADEFEKMLRYQMKNHRL